MRILTLSTLLFLLISQSTTAQVAPLEMIPASAAVVIRLQAPETTLNGVASFINKVQPGIGDLAKAQMLPALGRNLSNPTLAGIDQTQDWYVACFMDENRKPQSVMLIPTTDVAEVRKVMGTKFDFVEKDGWLACSTDDQCHARFESCVNGSVKSIAGSLDDRTKPMMMTGHLCIFVNAPVLKEAFAEELGSAEGRLEDLLQLMGNQIRLTNPQLDIGYVLDMYRDLGKVLLQGVRDSGSFAISVKVTDDALQIEQLLSVAADSKTDTFFQTQPVSDMQRLTSVPQGLAGYMAMHGNPDVVLDWSEQMMQNMFKDDEQKEQAAKSIALMRQAKFGTISAGGDLLPEADEAMRYFGVSEIGPTAVLLEAMQAFGTGMEYEIAGIVQKQTFEVDAEQIDGQSVGIYRLEQTMPAGLDPTGLQKALNDKLYGPDGIVQRIVMQDGLVLQTMGGDLESMQRLMASVQWSDSRLLAARARQHEEANLLILADVPNMVLKFAKLIIGTGMLPVPVQPEQLDGLEIAPSYAGFSMAVESQHLSTRTSIPVETFQGFAQIGMFVQQLGGQAR